MSNRTLVELNHDFCPSDEAKALKWALDMCAYMRAGDKSCLPDGVTFKYFRHHSEPDPMAGVPQAEPPKVSHASQECADEIFPAARISPYCPECESEFACNCEEDAGRTRMAMLRLSPQKGKP